MTNLDSILKSRNIILLTKVLLFKAMVFPVVMYGCESWTIKKAERPRIDAFGLWCLKKTLESPFDCKESILKEIRILIVSTGAEAETSILWPPDAKK